MTPFVQVLLFGLVGLALGAAFFAGLHRNVQAYVRGGIGPAAVLAHVGRLAAAVVVFWLVAHQGALALLSTAAGFVVARVVASWWVRRRAPC